MEIPLVFVDRSSFKSAKCSVPNQDYTAAMVISGGPMVSRLDGSTYHKVFDMLGPSGSLEFHMSVLDFSKLASKHAEFLGSGLAGWWKIHRCDSTNVRPPKITLQEAVTVASEDDLKQLVLHTSSAPFIRERYTKLLDNKDEYGIFSPESLTHT